MRAATSGGRRPVHRRLFVAILAAHLALLSACSDGDSRSARLDADARQTSPRPPSPAPSSSSPEEREARVFDGCVELGRSIEEVSYRASDGQRLEGVTLGDGRVGLLLAHQTNSSVCEWFPAAESLAQQGFRVLAFDFRGNGSSISHVRDPGRLDLDVAAGVEQLKRLGAEEVIAIGGSMGGTAVLVAGGASAPEGLAGVISMSGPSVFGDLDAGAAVRRLELPVLFVVARTDAPFATEARQMHRSAATDDKQLMVLPAGSHGSAMLAPPEDPGVRKAILTFIEDHTRL